ncbi:MAG: response regulator [Caldilineaceae bacterium]|nr:response regulator [Caldilineaceae bacterium]
MVIANNDPSIPSHDFVEQVRQTLSHLYDFPYLQNHPLSAAIGGESEGAFQASAGQKLRRVVMDALEALNPGLDEYFRSPHARLYNLLRLHYLEGTTVQEAATELGISLRQAHRDLRRGEEHIAAILWTMRRQEESPPLRAVELSSVDVEVRRVTARPLPVELQKLVKRACDAVTRLAEQHAIRFRFDLAPNPVIVSTDSVVAQQILTSLFSHTIQQAKPGEITVELEELDGQASLRLVYETDVAVEDAPLPELTERLIEKQGWQLHYTFAAQPVVRLLLRAAPFGPTVLVIDDNEGLVQLLDRYLSGHNCQVVAATSGYEGLMLAQELHPDAVILDVMMPEMDGWEVLQRLRAGSPSEDLPIIVCSVFNDPELAHSLGATQLLPKPVGRDDVLKALISLDIL